MKNEKENRSIEPKRARTDIDSLVPQDLLGDDEEVVIAIKPSLWAVLFWSGRTIFIAMLICAVVVCTRSLISWGHIGRYVVQGCGIAVVLRLGFATLQWASRTYVLTSRRVIRIRGVFRIDIFQCSLHRLQNTFLTLSLLQRILGLGDIAFSTAGTAGVEAIWRHVKAPLKVHQQLIRRINTAGHTQTEEGT